MMKLIQLIMKRPSDTQIRYGKVALGILLMLIAIIAFGIQNLQFKESFLGFELSKGTQLYLSHLIMFFGGIPITLGGLDVNFLSRGRTRIVQIIFGILILLLSGIFINKATLSIDILYSILGIIVIFFGITGKAITRKGKKQGQKITKIRV